MTKEIWSKPELIVILRNHPEETLQDEKCKHPAINGPMEPTPPACAEQSTMCHNSSLPS